MLSILIPTYNYDALPLVKQIHEQAVEAGIAFEILCLDDASPDSPPANASINDLAQARYEVLSKNIGRSKIRNLLARKAQYDWLLFLDVDVLPVTKNFIENYLSQLNGNAKIISGGIVYQSEKPEQKRLFRWLYGKNREALSCEKRNRNPYLSLLTLNFLIHRSVFDVVAFNEEIPNLRHEDTLFSFDLKQHQIPIRHIENPVLHLGIDVFETAIRKENESLVALKFLIDHQLIATDYLRLAKLFTAIKKMGSVKLFAFADRLTRKAFLKNLSGNSPSLLAFDLYRVGYLCTLEQN